MKSSQKKFRWLRAVPCLAVLSSGCGGATEGELVHAQVAVESLSEGTSFTTDTGWEVQLEEARAVLGPLYVYAPASGAMAWTQLLGVSVAHAHTGVDPLSGRIVRAEWREQVLVDLLATEPTVLGTTDAEAGLVDAATLVLQPPAAGHEVAMHGHHFWVSGTAVQDEHTIRFEGGLDLPDIGLTRRVEQVPASGYLSEGVRIVVGVDPRLWFEGAHFERLAQGEPGQPRAITEDSQVRAAWFLGVRNVHGYRIRLEEQGEQR